MVIFFHDLAEEVAREKGRISWEGEMASNPISRKEEEKGGSPSLQRRPCPLSSDSASEMSANECTMPKIVAAVLEAPAMEGPRKSSSVWKPG